MTYPDSSPWVPAEVLDAAPVLVVRLDEDGRVSRVNAHFERVTRWPAGEARGREWLSTFLPEHERERVRGVFQALLAGGRAAESTSAIATRDGAQRTIEWQLTALRDGAGQPNGVFAIGVDITDRVGETWGLGLAQAAAQAERARLRAVIDVFPGVVGLYTVDGDFVDANARSFALTGRVRGEPVPQKVWDLPQYTSSPELRERVRDAFARGRHGEAVTFELRGPAATGALLELEASFRPVRDAAGVVTHIAAFGVDLSARNEALARSRETEQRLNEAQRLARLGSWDLDLVTNALTWSDEVFRIFEIDATRFGASYDAFLALVHPEDRELVDSSYRRSLETREAYEVAHRLLMPDGRIKHVLERGQSFWDASGRALRSAGTVQDVSAHVLADQALAATQTRLLRAEALAKVGSWSWDLRTGEMRWSPEMYRIYGVDPAEHPHPTVDLGLSRVHPRARARAGEATRLLEETGRFEPVEFQLLLGGGEVRTVRAEGEIDRGQGRRVLYGFVQDVTEERDLRVALQEAKTRLEQTLSSIFDGFFTLDARDWTYTYINPAGARMMGRTVEQLTGKCIWEEFPEGVGTAFDLGYRHVATERVPVTVVDHYGPLDQWLEASIYPMEGGVSVYFRDVTKRKQAQLALEESEARFRSLMEQAGDAIFIADTDANYLDVNPAACELVGFSRDELLQMSARDLLIDPAAQGLDDELPAIRSGDSSRRGWQMRRKDGTVIDIEANIKLLSDGRVLGLTRDVSKQTKLDRDLRSSLARLRNVMDSLFGVVAIVSLDGTLLDTNRAPLEASGLTPEAVLGKKLWDTHSWSFAPEAQDRAKDAFERARGGEVIRYETQVRGDDGRLIDVEVVFGPVRDAEDRIVEVVAFSVDITSRKRADMVLRDRDAEIRASLAEKEMLLREIHHRVKNNLQIILSLLHFQTQNLRVPQELTALTELRQRILAMVLVHERLYQAHDVARVDLGDYVRTLVAELGRSFSWRLGVRIDVTADEVPLPIELAIPCGMILCELVTNVVKYAFPATREGRATVVVRADGDRVVLAVDDEGVGFPPGFDPRGGRSFGWELVRTLVLQLDGRVEASTDRGAHVRVSFPAPT